MVGTVVHLPERDAAYGERAVRNVENLLADDTIDEPVALVANGGGVAHLRRDAATAERVRDLLAADVDVCACANTVDRADPAASPLIDGVRVVSSAMAELTRRQADGAAYVRP